MAYLTAPSNGGESAAVLPMFCRKVGLAQEEVHALSAHALCQQRCQPRLGVYLRSLFSFLRQLVVCTRSQLSRYKVSAFFGGQR